MTLEQEKCQVVAEYEQSINTFKNGWLILPEEVS